MYYPNMEAVKGENDVLVVAFSRIEAPRSHSLNNQLVLIATTFVTSRIHTLHPVTHVQCERHLVSSSDKDLIIFVTLTHRLLQ